MNETKSQSTALTYVTKCQKWVIVDKDHNFFTNLASVTTGPWTDDSEKATVFEYKYEAINVANSFRDIEIGGNIHLVIPYVSRRVNIS